MPAFSSLCLLLSLLLGFVGFAVFLAVPTLVFPAGWLHNGVLFLKQGGEFSVFGWVLGAEVLLLTGVVGEVY
jgi:hypothetical protein